MHNAQGDPEQKAGNKVASPDQIPAGTPIYHRTDGAWCQNDAAQSVDTEGCSERVSGMVVVAWRKLSPKR